MVCTSRSTSILSDDGLVFNSRFSRRAFDLFLVHHGYILCEGVTTQDYDTVCAADDVFDVEDIHDELYLSISPFL